MAHEVIVIPWRLIIMAICERNSGKGRKEPSLGDCHLLVTAGSSHIYSWRGGGRTSLDPLSSLSSLLPFVWPKGEAIFRRP